MNEEEKIEDKKTETKDKILGEIRSGVILMRPKASFTFRFILLVCLVALIGLVSVFIFNLIVFTARINQYHTLLGFGYSGFYTFIKFFPWYLMLINTVFILILLALVRKFKFGYKIPVLYLLSGIFATTALFAVALDFGTELNDSLLRKSKNLPRPIGHLYNSADKSMPRGSGVCFCKIISIGEGGLIAQDNRNDGYIFRVVLPEDGAERILSGLVPGSLVLIAGRESGGVIEAFGISKINQKIKISN